MPGRGTRPRQSGASTRRTAFPLNSVAGIHSAPRIGATYVAVHTVLGPALITAVGEAPLSPHSVGGRGRTPSLAPLIQGPARPTQTRHRPTTAVLSYIRHSETPRHWVCQSSIPTTGCTSYYFLELVLARQGPIVIYYHTRHVDVGIGVGCILRLSGRSTSKKEARGAVGREHGSNTP